MAWAELHCSPGQAGLRAAQAAARLKAGMAGKLRPAARWAWHYCPVPAAHLRQVPAAGHCLRIRKAQARTLPIPGQIVSSYHLGMVAPHSIKKRAFIPASNFIPSLRSLSMAEILVRKADGTSEPLDYNKMRQSLLRAGASRALCEEVIESLQPRMESGITTEEIYRMAFERLRELRVGAAARFGLKAALLRFGPDGHPFETFVGALLRGRGYVPSLRQTLRGKCVQHEIDVVASRPAIQGHPATKFIAECKFHNSPHLQCHIQTALYSWARFLDVHDANRDIDSGWLVTNTKFSYDVIQYSDCVGLKLLGWSFPREESIQVRIEENKLYPTTLLSRLDRRGFEMLHSAGIILVKDVASMQEERLRQLGFSEKYAAGIKDEAKRVMSGRG